MIKKPFSQGAQTLRESDKWDLQYRLVSAMVGERGPKGLIQGGEVQEDTQQTSQDPRKHGRCLGEKKELFQADGAAHAKVQRSGR